MSRRITVRNIIASLALQIFTLINGLIVPKLILSFFGSDVNGLVSSITQFLNYITLLEGGIGAVVMAALYKPLAENDSEKVGAVIRAAKNFFKSIALIYVVYAVFLAIIGPLVIWKSFEWKYVALLVVVIAINSFVQYYFSICYKILLNADRKGYVVYLTQIVFLIVNLLLAIIVIRMYPSIHILKLANAIAFCIQPLVFSIFVKKHYRIDEKCEPDKAALSQRWDGFGQNIAYVVHMNTDVTVLTLLSSLSNVSIYSVYNLVAVGLKNIVVAVSSAILPSLGRVLVKEDIDETNKAFDTYELVIGLVTTFLYSCGAMLINKFVSIYTMNITDANYSQPVFGLLLIIAMAFGSIREPYINVANAAGHFRRIAKYAYIEAIINIAVSVVLVWKLGLIGVAIGTLIASMYRYIAQILYLRNNVLNRPIIKSIKSCCCCILTFSVNYYLLSLLFEKMQPQTYGAWFIEAILTAIAVGLVTLVVSMLFHFKEMKKMLRRR